MSNLEVKNIYSEFTPRKICSRHFGQIRVTFVRIFCAQKFKHPTRHGVSKEGSTSIMDEVVLVYRVTGPRREIRDLQLQKNDLKNEMTNLRAEIYKIQYKTIGIRISDNESVLRETIRRSFKGYFLLSPNNLSRKTHTYSEITRLYRQNTSYFHSEYFLFTIYLVYLFSGFIYQVSHIVKALY